MPDERPISSSRITATDVARHSFGTVRRGFDPREVRSYLELVARELQALEDVQQEWRRELAEAEQRARHPVLDEATLTAALGQQTAQVLRNAYEEAGRLVAEAERRAAAVVHEADQRLAEASVRAEAQAAQRIAEAELAASAVRDQGEADAQRIVEAGRRDGEELVARAREHGRQMVDEAQAARKRVLEDLAQRRRAFHVQIEQLRAARDELVDAVRSVRDRVDEITGDLLGADEEARRAANLAGRRSRSQPTDEELALAAESTVLGELVPIRPDVGEHEVGGELEEHGVESAVESGGVERGEEAEAPPPEPPPEHPAGAEGGANSGGLRGRIQRIDRGQRRAPEPGPSQPGNPASGPPGPAPPGSGAAPPEASSATLPASGAEQGSTAPGTGDEVAGAVDVTAVVRAVREREQSEQTDPDAGSIDTRSLEDLFARIRASRSAEVEAQETAETGDTGDTGKTPAEGAGSAARARGTGKADAPAEAGPAERDVAGSAERDVAGPAGGGDADLLARRDDLLEPVTATLARRLKRSLQDDQNRLLDGLRASSGKWSDELLGTVEEHRERFAEAARGPLLEAAKAGFEFSHPSSNGDGRGTPDAPEAGDVDAIAVELGSSIVTLLRRRLPGGEEGPSPEDVDDASDVVGAAYRELRGARVQRLAGDAALSAFGAGVLRGAGGGPVRWVVGRGDGEPCADCEDNSLAGDLGAGDAFPTGQARPPAHAGCRCLVAPAG